MSIKDYQPTPEQIESHRKHEEARKLFCKELEVKNREKWSKSKKK